MVLRQKLKSNEKSSATKCSDTIQPDDAIIEDDMEYVTVLVSEENQMDDVDHEDMQLFEPVEIEEYNERVVFEDEMTELEVAEDECNSDIETSVITEHDSTAVKLEVAIASDKQAASMMKGTDYSADESIATSSQGGEGVGVIPKKQRFRQKHQHANRKSFKCEICGKILSNQSSHKYHMQLHSAATPFLCSECGKGFKTRNAYDGHKITHLSSNPNTCEICGNSYRQAASLRNHMLVHTGVKVICVDRGIHAVIKYFNRMHAFLFHLQPFVCSICGKGMTQKSGFKVKKIIHESVEPLSIILFYIRCSSETHAHSYGRETSHLRHLRQGFPIFQQPDKSSASSFRRTELRL